jgi:3-oxoadipate enol-lactonase
MSVAQLPGADLYYEFHGEGAALVLIHGAGGSHLSWWQQIPAFQKRHRVIVYDQRGFGGSRPTGVYDPGEARALTQDLENLIERLAPTGPISLVGHSLGTFPALDYAERHPDRVSRLVLSGAYGGLTTPGLETAIEHRRRLFESPMPFTASMPRSEEELPYFSMTEIPNGLFGSKFSAARPDLAFLYGAFAALARGPSLQDLSGVFQTGRRIDSAAAKALRIPVLVIDGVEDQIYPPGELAAAAAAFPNGRYHGISDAGHCSYFERPDAFNEAVLGFLAE